MTSPYILLGLAVAALIWLLVPGTVAQQSSTAPSPYDARMLELDRLAADDAYRAHLAKLFGVWMSDEHGQPHRAITGANRARRAYIGVMQEIDKRDNAQRERDRRQP